ncbi:MAG: DUF2852 domain-containing protein [Stappiaceae bacterium]
MTSTHAIRPAWTPITIGLMVLGFIAFWPLGLAMLAYILWGDRFQEFAQRGKEEFRGCKRAFNMNSTSSGGFSRTGNVAFDDYRAAEMKRLEEERRKLDKMRAEFDDFMANLRRAKDQEEFDRFMRNRSMHQDQGSQDQDSKSNY